MVELPWRTEVAAGTAAPNPVVDGGFDLGSFVKDVAPDVISVVGTGLGASSAISDNKEINAAIARGIRESTDRLTRGYDEQLGHIEEGSDYLRQLLEAGLIDVTDYLRLASEEYGQKITRNVGDYSGYLLPQFDEFGNLIMAADETYGQNLAEVERGTGDYLQQGLEGFEEAYAPYTQGGDAAMEYLMQVMATNPEQLTPSQQRMVEDYRRDAIARVAASGLRGSGRAGIAAVNEGDAELAANFYDINQRRADDAARSMAQYGYGSAGQVAGSRQATANRLADTRFKTGNLQAANTLNAQNTIANTGFNLTQDFAQRGLSAADKAAEAQYGTTRDVAGAVGDYYGNLGKVEGGRFQSRADTSFGKALAEAGGASRLAQADANTLGANSNIRNSAIGQIANTLSNVAKEQLGRENDKSKSLQI